MLKTAGQVRNSTHSYGNLNPPPNMGTSVTEAPWALLSKVAHTKSHDKAMKMYGYGKRGCLKMHVSLAVRVFCRDWPFLQPAWSVMGLLEHKGKKTYFGDI